MYDKQGKMTRAGMEQVIRDGGSVLHGGKLHTRLDTLPTAADLAAGDEQATAEALAGIEAQQKSLDAQRQKLLAARAPKSADDDGGDKRQSHKSDAKR